ncbi:MAG: hypothetical protein WC470_02155 [Candidatus Paceibacterota bacterium]
MSETQSIATKSRNELKMKGVIKIAREAGVIITWNPDGKDEGFGRYEMGIIGAGIIEFFAHGNDIISIDANKVSLLVRRTKFLPHALHLAEKLQEHGYQTMIEKDF